jgi:Zn-dependent protease with chaperone function
MFEQKTRRAAALMMALLLVPLAATAQTRVKPGFNLFSPEQDVEIGQQSAAAAQQQLPLLNDAQVNAYVNNIGQRLAANAGGPGFQYQFRVVNASDINAFALPGGFIYVNRGVLDQAHNEGEVAGVLAHEISHVALRHGTHQASKAYAAQAGISILSGILGGRVGQGTADIINAVGGLGLNALFLKYSRDLETQADVRGSQILAASGYSPVDMVNFFKTLERADASKKTNWMSDHPAPPDRIARIEREAQMLHVTSNPTTNAAGLQSMQARLRGYGSAPTSAQIAQGVTSGNTTRRRSGPMTSTSSIGTVPAPSSSLRSYTNRSGLYRISFPSNWQVYQEGSTGVTIAPEGGIGNVDGRTEIVYGAVINHYDPFNNASSLQGGGSTTLDNATNDLIAEIERDSPYLRAVNGSGQRIRMGGGSALAATLRGQNPATGVTERATVVTRQLADEHLLYMLFITPDRDAANYNRVLNEMVSSMQVATNAAH